MKNYEYSGPSDETVQLEYFADSSSSMTYPGYPASENRLRASENRLRASETTLERDCEGRIIIPLNERWTIDKHQNRTGDETAPDADTRYSLIQQGYELDSIGRPIHPWFWRMFCDPRLGVVAGRGFFRDWGPNYTADPIVIYKDRLLLIQRADNGRWALPGGFVNCIDDGSYEDSLSAGLREAKEETGHVINPEVSNIHYVYNGPVADIRSTANAWTHTTAFLIKPLRKIEQTEPVDYTEVLDVGWFPVDTVTESVLVGSHKFLVEKALQLEIKLQ